jgi:protein-tyrosine phosphatase
LIDIHHHCLPGVDDGPKDWSEAVELCAAAREEGIETIVATPHVLRGRWQNTSRPKLELLAEALRDRVGAAPRILLGSEYFFAHDMTEILRTGGGIIPLAGSRYVLVEFAAHAVPPLIEQPFYHAQLEGWTPIIAHPERNSVFQAKPELLVRLIELGAKTQVTCDSVTGHFGGDAQKAALEWIAAGLVHMMATDAHNLKRRPPRTREAIDTIRGTAGDEVAVALTHSNPAAVIEGRGLPWEPEPRLPRRRGGFLSGLKELFGHREHRSH